MADEETETLQPLYSEHQTNVLLALYYVTPPLSLLGSGTILYILARPMRSLPHVNPTFQRLLLGYAVMDVLQTVVWLVLGPWATPATDNPIVPDATGSVATCNAKGFFFNFAFGLMMYSASLACYHSFKVVLEWPDFFISRGFEPAFHLLSWGWPVLMGAPSIWYANVNVYPLLPGTCWITHLPGVRGSPTQAQSVERLFGFTTFFVSLVVTAVAFFSLYYKARTMERRLRQTSRGATNITQISRQTGRQGMRYSLAFLLCNISWPFLVFLNNQKEWNDDQHQTNYASRCFFPLAVYSFLLTPLQGFVNAVLFVESHRAVLQPGVGPLGWLSQIFTFLRQHVPHMPKREHATAIESMTDHRASNNHNSHVLVAEIPAAAP